MSWGLATAKQIVACCSKSVAAAKSVRIIFTDRAKKQVKHLSILDLKLLGDFSTEIFHIIGLTSLSLSSFFPERARILNFIIKRHLCDKFSTVKQISLSRRKAKTLGLRNQNCWTAFWAGI